MTSKIVPEPTLEEIKARHAKWCKKWKGGEGKVGEAPFVPHKDRGILLHRIEELENIITEITCTAVDDAIEDSKPRMCRMVKS